MKTVFNNFVLYFNFLLLGLVTAALFRLVIMGDGGRELLSGFPQLIAPAVGLGVVFFRLGYPDRWRRLVAGFTGSH